MNADRFGRSRAVPQDPRHTPSATAKSAGRAHRIRDFIYETVYLALVGFASVLRPHRQECLAGMPVPQRGAEYVSVLLKPCTKVGPSHAGWRSGRGWLCRGWTA